MKNKNKFFIGIFILTIILITLNWNRYFGIKETYPAPPLLGETVDVLKVKRDNESIYIPTIYRGDCKVMSTDSLKNFSSYNNFTNGVPRILHYVSNEEDIPKAYTEMYKNCGKLNKDVLLVLWTDASFYKVFITQFETDVIEKWKVIFSNLDDPLRTSMIRSMVLYVFGGVSLSLDTVCQKPIRDAFTKNYEQKGSCFVSVGNSMRTNIEFDVENEFGESVIGCVARHPFFQLLISNKMSLKLNRMYFTDYFEYYNKVNEISPVRILDLKVSEQLLPKPEMEKTCNRNSTGVKRSLACKLLKKIIISGPSKAMMIHMPSYGVSNVQIVADDICSAGIPVHIVII